MDNLKLDILKMAQDKLDHTKELKEKQNAKRKRANNLSIDSIQLYCSYIADCLYYAVKQNKFEAKPIGAFMDVFIPNYHSSKDLIWDVNDVIDFDKFYKYPSYWGMDIIDYLKKKVSMDGLIEYNLPIDDATKEDIKNNFLHRATIKPGLFNCLVNVVQPGDDDALQPFYIHTLDADSDSSLAMLGVSFLLYR